MPFNYRKYGKIVEITEIEKETSKVRVYAARKRRVVFGARRPDNIRRTKQICLRRVLSAIEELGCPLLVTLTFAGDASDASLANDSLRSFQVRLHDKFTNAHSIFVPELSPRGRIHFHGLLFGVPLSLGDTLENRRVVSYGEERRDRILARLWKKGFVDAKKTDGSGKLAFYISKYITKGADEVLFNAMRLIRTSRGFPKEIFIRGEVAEFIAKQYSKRQAVSEWTHHNVFLGKINRKTYRL